MRPCALFLPLGLVALLAGCQLQLPGGKGAGPDGVTPDAVIGDAIEVTPLDAPAPVEGAEDQPSETPPEAGKEAQAAPPEEVAEEAPVAEIEPAPQPDLEETVPEVQKSDQQIACEKKKGQWSKVGSLSYTCIFRTKDAGEHCSKGSQCEGECLARSGTCSPIRPLLGCNEILQDDGRRVTLCID